jgi:predicted transcriptional regulator
MQTDMPVDFDEYRAERAENGDLPIDPDSNAFRILSFLAEHPELGFKPSEIRARVDVPRGSLNPTLARLEERGLVEHEPPYWSAGDDDRLSAIAGIMHSMEAFEDRYGDDEFDGWHESDVDPRDRR